MLGPSRTREFGKPTLKGRPCKREEQMSVPRELTIKDALAAICATELELGTPGRDSPKNSHRRNGRTSVLRAGG